MKEQILLLIEMDFEIKLITIQDIGLLTILRRRISIRSVQNFPDDDVVVS